jgi:CheY-like chemotaxis protein
MAKRGMSLATPSLLITDDDRAIREALREVFEPRGFHTFMAADGQQAVSIVRQNIVHLVLMDLQMPGLTGIEAARRVKEHRAELPCILISGAIDEEVLAEAEEVPVFSVLVKPISVRKVTDTVHLALREVYNWLPPT